MTLHRPFALAGAAALLAGCAGPPCSAPQSGDAPRLARTGSLEDAALRLQGSGNTSWRDVRAVSGQLTRDCKPELVVATPDADGDGSGAAWTVEVAGPAERLLDFTNAIRQGAEVGRGLDTGDLDGDGRDELVVGRYAAVEIVWSGGGDTDLLEWPDGRNGFGSSVAVVADPGGGAWLAVTDPDRAAYDLGGPGFLVLYSGPALRDGDHEPAAVVRGLDVPEDRRRIDAVRALGDLNGDGIDDLVVTGSSHEVGDGEVVDGHVSVLPGPLARVGALTDDVGVIRAAAPDRFAPLAVDSGDLDGDGALDLLVGLATPPGQLDFRLTLFEGPFDGGDRVFQQPDATGSTDPFTRVLGDLDGDGIDDLGYGIPQAEGGAGLVGITFGPVGASLSRDPDVELVGTTEECESGGGSFEDGPDTEAGDQLGRQLLPLGDVDRDGYDDFAVTAPTWSSNADDSCIARLHEGAVFVFRGGPR